MECSAVWFSFCMHCLVRMAFKKENNKKNQASSDGTRSACDATGGADRNIIWICKWKNGRKRDGDRLYTFWLKPWTVVLGHTARQREADGEWIEVTWTCERIQCLHCFRLLLFFLILQLLDIPSGCRVRFQRETNSLIFLIWCSI